MALRHFGAAAISLALVPLALATPAHAVTEIQWWHAMTGPNNDVVVKLANDFNASQTDYKIVPTFKGSYADTLNAGIAAFRAGNAAGIITVILVLLAWQLIAMWKQTVYVPPVSTIFLRTSFSLCPALEAAGHEVLGLARSAEAHGAQMAELARKHQLLLLTDEIYDKILYDDAKHISMASLAPDVLCLTFNGLSKAYRVAGYRAGWLAITGPKEHASSFLEGIHLLANMRLCPNVPAQHAIQVALGGHQSIDDLVLPGGRLLEQRDVAWSKLNEIPGVSCVKPAGALYTFPRLDPEVHDIEDDEQLVLDLLLSEKILVTQGTGFNWPAPDHLRIVTLPWSRDLARAIERLGNFLASYRQ